jgi:hypothetical protein
MYVEIVHSPANINLLRAFNAERYASLNIAMGQTNEVIAQIGRLIKSKSGPFAAYDVRRATLMGTSASSGTVRTFLGAHATLRMPDGKPIFFIADLGGGQIGQLPPGSVVLLPASSRIATGVGLPPAFRNIPPFNLLPNVGTPLSDAEVLTPTEQQAIAARAVAYNEVIAQAASSRDIPVADIKGLFDRFASPTGYRVGPFTFSSAYLQGGIFSFDGFHLTDIGYMFFANEYIRTINSAYDEDIPVAGLSQFFANNGAFATTAPFVTVTGTVASAGSTVS